MAVRLYLSIRRAAETAALWKVVGCSVVLGLAVAAVDLATGHRVSVSFFYALPLAVLTWRLGRWAAAGSAVGAAVIWLTVDLLTQDQPSPALSVWNALVRLAFFITINGLLYGLRTMLDGETRLARIDSLTGLANRAAFVELAGRELARARRTGEAVTLAVLDLDDLKRINDTHGHAAGDAALAAMGDVLRVSLRAADLAARIGGDEFAVLLVGPQTHAEVALERVRRRLGRFSVGDFALRCSIGATIAVGYDLEEAMAGADGALYEVKRNGKGRMEMREGSVASFL